MAITARQTNLLVNQDWTLVYQSFKQADFQSYDFDTLRKSMIDYLRMYYPEDFNDFTDSSEYIALIDLLAFLGQSLAFRMDLNARENFFDTAERRDSVLKLARLINYNATRAVSASGLLKIDSISTTESVTDSNGLNLSNLLVNWNDSSNQDWREQFAAILNASFISGQMVGNPGNSQSISGIQTDEYSINLAAGVTPTYSFSATVGGNNTNFEAVSASTVGTNYIYEVSPAASGRFNILYRNDNLGNASNNTGYFVYFKQGALGHLDFNLSQGLPNRIVSTTLENVNNTDTWLYQLNPGNTSSTLWKQVPSVAGVNVIYNHSSNRNLYQINTLVNDNIELVFGDGSFTNIPQGNFRLFYRTCNAQRYKITPDEMQGIILKFNYISANNRLETLTIRAGLHYTVANADYRETSDAIRTKAPANYYTQNRMITGEDYNLFPYVNFNDILKVKAVNRSSSGISRYLDVLDPTGKYSTTNIFAEDGLLYEEVTNQSLNFSFTTANDIYNMIYNMVEPTLASTEVKQFYYDRYRNSPIAIANISWYPTVTNSGTSVGYLVNTLTVQDIGRLTNSNLKFIVPGTMIKFTAGSGKYFNAQGVITDGVATYQGDRAYIYATVVSTSAGNIIRLDQNLPRGAVVDSIIPVFKTSITDGIMLAQITQLIQSYKNFGVTYNQNTMNWQIILPADININGQFSLANQGDVSSSSLDSSWLICFSYNGASYNFAYRSLRYVFESLEETRFAYDPDATVYDSRTGLTVRDHIKVLKVNSMPDDSVSLAGDQLWYIDNKIVDPDGYDNTSKIYVTFADTNNDGYPDDPDLFSNIVNPTVNVSRKFVYFRTDTGNSNFLSTVPVDNSTIVSAYGTKSDIITNQNLYLSGQIFYAPTEGNFYILAIDDKLVRTLTKRTDYIARIGRQDLHFQYRHNSSNDRRIDPSPNNIVDMYILTKQYTADYLNWIQDTTGMLSEPSVPTNDSLKLTYGSGVNSLENFKALSDTIVYNSGVYKPVFGAKAPLNLQANFKVVKNPNSNVSDNDIKTRVIAAVNTYFSTNNWDFGESFYFSELSTYLHNALAPSIASIIIVPTDTDIAFGALMQINANPNEVIVSAATVDNVQIISAITAAQLNQTLVGLNR